MTDQAAPRQSAVDEQWYLRSYPQARGEIDNSSVWNATEHYRKIGRFRGYLPDAQARRPDNPAAPRSRFGGLWTDQANALDLLKGKHQIGQLSDAQAELIDHWIREGYVILPGAIPDEILDPAVAELENAYHGQLPGLAFENQDPSDRITTFQPRYREVPAKALDLHWSSAATRDAVFAPTITGFLESIFERRPLVSQTLGFWRGSQQGGHQDSAYVSYSLNMHFAAAWIAYEDVTPGAGALVYYPKSQELPEFLYGQDAKNLHDAGRADAGADFSGQIHQHVAELPGRLADAGIEPKTFIAKRGDVLIWSADLVHGGTPISENATRKSMVAHYCPQELAPTYFEAMPRDVAFHKDAYAYATSYY